MLVTEVKSKGALLDLAGEKTVIICCEGCNEIHLPNTGAAELIKQLLKCGVAKTIVVTDYICDPENLTAHLQKHTGEIGTADALLVFSCGVGVQTAAEILPHKRVYAACDTYPLPGFQGVTPPEYDCAQCGECRLNDTGGICPVTLCPKSLVNGPCGGCKNGKCEVDKDIDCGWDRIYKRLKIEKRILLN